ncbi:actin-1-like isoform X2 [Haliaeetus albicilla]|uniref:actin-1-like isoform X2 n=1 Tax=Haliaeetus albicilla TaxID=8969 RepID=UPI0037E81585
MSDLAAAGTRAVIFDIGSGQCKAGLSGEQAPRSVISTVVGYPKFKLVMFGVRHKDCYIGEEAQSKRGILSFTYPMENGVVTSWDDMEKIMFESFQVPALFVTLQALTALYASARTTGLVLDSGDGVTVTVPVYKGCYLLHGITRRDFAGKGVTKYLARLLSEAGQSFVSTAEREIVRDMKEKLCYVALDPSQNMQEKPEKLTCEYILPDGRAVKVGDQLFRAPETLFVPAEAEIPGPGVGRMVLQSVAKCREHIQPDMLRNVLLSGGSTLFRGFKERLLKELQTGIPSTTPVKIISPQDRMHSVWIGASILASLRTFRNMWVTREDYDEVGPTVLQRKCF